MFLGSCIYQILTLGFFEKSDTYQNTYIFVKMKVCFFLFKKPCLRLRLLISVQKQRSTGYFSATNAPIPVLNFQTKLIEVWIILEHKKDTKTPSVLGMWVLGVGLGLGRRG